MKVCFVGIGSIATRHIRNLSVLCRKRGIELRVDALRRNTSSASDKQEGLESVFYSTEELPDDYDVIFLTNPTEYHADMLARLHDNGKHFFIEKPVTSFSTIDKLAQIDFRSDSVYYVACPLRYSRIIQYLKSQLDITRLNAVRSISSSYLPEWRPGSDYRESYSSRRELGGGVDIDLIHEWDYLTYLFGMPTDVKKFSGKVSKLEINSCDYAIYIAQYGDRFTCELHLDYYGRKPIRAIELYMDDDTIVCDLIAGEVRFMKSGHLLDMSEERDDHQRLELEHFLDIIAGKSDSDNNIDNAVRVLKLTQGMI